MEAQTTYLLWTLVTVGLWNGVNFVARLYYREPSAQYVWSIALGAWAVVILVAR